MSNSVKRKKFWWELMCTDSLLPLLGTPHIPQEKVLSQILSWHRLVFLNFINYSKDIQNNHIWSHSRESPEDRCVQALPSLVVPLVGWAICGRIWRPQSIRASQEEVFHRATSPSAVATLYLQLIEGQVPAVSAFPITYLPTRVRYHCSFDDMPGFYWNPACYGFQICKLTFMACKTLLSGNFWLCF